MSIKKPPRSRAQCGTPAGHQQHAKRGEHQCEACRKAWAEYHRARRNGEDLSQFRSKTRTASVIRREQQRAADRLMAMDDAEFDQRFPPGEGEAQ